MAKRSVAPVFNRFNDHRYLFLLVSILCYLALFPLFKQHFALGIIIDGAITLLLISGVYASGSMKGVSLTGILLALPMLAATWIDDFVTVPWLVPVGRVSGIIFFTFIIIRTLLFIFRTKRVTGNVLCGSIVVYLLIAVMWAFMYGIIEHSVPGSFSISRQADSRSFFMFIYYSFVTITTLGYGDVSPLTDTARAFAVLEAAIGQIYLVVLVARLVGIHIAQSMRHDVSESGDAHTGVICTAPHGAQTGECTRSEKLKTDHGSDES